MTTTEEWRSVPSNVLLEASSFGRIRSVEYEGPLPLGRGFRKYKMSPTYGYTVSVSDNYYRKQVTFRRKTYKVHSLVAEAFLGLRPQGLVVSHQDENALNNTPGNLEYTTRKENHNMPKLKEYHRAVCGWKMGRLKGEKNEVV